MFVADLWEIGYLLQNQNEAAEAMWRVDIDLCIHFPVVLDIPGQCLQPRGGVPSLFLPNPLA